MITAKEVISTNYSLDIPTKKLIEIMRKDGNCDAPLYIRLGNIKGVYDIDYDGHFGPHIFLSVEIEHDELQGIEHRSAAIRAAQSFVAASSCPSFSTSRVSL